MGDLKGIKETGRRYVREEHFGQRKARSQGVVGLRTGRVLGDVGANKPWGGGNSRGPTGEGLWATAVRSHGQSEPKNGLI